MKHVILTDYEAGQIDTYLELTSGRISEELALWESMEGKTPNAKKNISFWKEMAQAVEKAKKSVKII